MCNIMTALSSSSRGRAWLPRLRALLTFQRSKHTVVDGGDNGEFCTQICSGSLIEADHMEFHNWRKLDSRTFGIRRSMISPASWTVVKLLQNEGYEAYLVGGCVRDLILKRIPKDFDVITTAALPKIRKKFRQSIIIGRRFPICRVNIKGSVVEVSSFDTAEKKNKKVRMPAGCDERDTLRWRDCMRRDFTINSLFYDPFVNKIYDYSNALMDLKSLKLRTLVSAHLSFKEDSARILRGLRLAARLNLSFTKETETAIQKLSSSTLSLNTSRLIMEVNYMLSYGAAERSVCLLKRYHLLEFLFPIQNAYLNEQSCLESLHDSMMLMKLFSKLDLLVTCDRPSDSTLWLAILAFHTALIKVPQHAIVVLAFGSLLYHGKWEEGIRYAREHIDAALRYETEILDSGYFLSDDELAERVVAFATLVKDSVDVLTDKKSLLDAMVNFPGYTCSGFVFVSSKMGIHVKQVFDRLVEEGESITSLNLKRKSFEIKYDSLGVGDIRETSFVLGKIIIDTMIPTGNSCNGLVSKEKDGRDEINPPSESDFSGVHCHAHLDPEKAVHEMHSSWKETTKQQKSVFSLQQKEIVKNNLALIRDQKRDDFLTLDFNLKEKGCESPQDEFQTILGDVIHESRNNDRSKKVKLIHDTKSQLSSSKHSRMLKRCHNVLQGKQEACMQKHHFSEEEEIVVDRDEPNLDHRGLTSAWNAGQTSEVVESKKVPTRLSHLFNRGLTSKPNAEQSSEIVESKKNSTRLSHLFK
ncbi:mRNA polyadenylation factor [Lithospermum erythrorhizon]|uniref:mRNA polyadenylation factor n=1 Tax=Lithospermum erythrorhizon TaxID=34254 RepID=A0AAV3Q0N9_LITER